MKVSGRAGGDNNLRMSAEYIISEALSTDGLYNTTRYDRIAAWRGLELLILRVRFLEYGLFLAWDIARAHAGCKTMPGQVPLRDERREETRQPHKSRTEWPVRRKEIPVMPAWPA